jgi:hypothetical protein
MPIERQPVEPRSLESLFDLSEPRADWSDADLAGMLRHQLAQPLEPAGPMIRELLASREPSVDSLQALKRLSKVRRAQAGGSASAELWRVIYFAAIAAAARAGHRITDLSDDELDAGYGWSLARPWLDPELRSLLSS